MLRLRGLGLLRQLLLLLQPLRSWRAWREAEWRLLPAAGPKQARMGANAAAAAATRLIELYIALKWMSTGQQGMYHNRFVLHNSCGKAAPIAIPLGLIVSCVFYSLGSAVLSAVHAIPLGQKRIEYADCEWNLTNCKPPHGALTPRFWLRSRDCSHHQPPTSSCCFGYIQIRRNEMFVTRGVARRLPAARIFYTSAAFSTPRAATKGCAPLTPLRKFTALVHTHPTRHNMAPSCVQHTLHLGS